MDVAEADMHLEEVGMGRDRLVEMHEALDKFEGMVEEDPEGVMEEEEEEGAV